MFHQLQGVPSVQELLIRFLEHYQPTRANIYMFNVTHMNAMPEWRTQTVLRDAQINKLIHISIDGGVL